MKIAKGVHRRPFENPAGGSTTDEEDAQERRRRSQEVGDRGRGRVRSQESDEEMDGLRGLLTQDRVPKTTEDVSVPRV